MISERRRYAGNVEREGYINGYEYVDLGLPSGLLWAVCNIGAEEETGYGNRFQWGDTQGYSTSQIGSGTGQKSFNWTTYKYGNGTSSPGAAGMTKYNSTDGLTILEASDDAAIANMGGGWRMPTVDEMTELVNNTIHERVTINGVSGLRIESSSNSSRYIFIPDAGYYNGTTLNYENERSIVWLADVASYDKRYGRALSYESDGFHTTRMFTRGCGIPIRGVHAAVI